MSVQICLANIFNSTDLETFINLEMSKKFVLIPLQTFQDLCSSTKTSGSLVTGVIKSLSEDAPEKRKRKAKPDKKSDKKSKKAKIQNTSETDESSDSDIF